jgi:alcohol dehydrogenase (cytochrome c)
MATETEYVDAGEAVDFRNLSPGYIGTAPPVAKDVGYDRILKGRDAEPHNWLTYYGAYDGQRYSLLDQINTSNVKHLKPEWVFQCGRWACTRVPRPTRWRRPRSSSTASCT